MYVNFKSQMGSLSTCSIHSRWQPPLKHLKMKKPKLDCLKIGTVSSLVVKGF